MAILRDVVICYDGSVRNICSNSILQLKYREDDVTDFPSDIAPGEPVGVLAATAISNPAYKAVLDASQSNNTSWELMKEILQTKVNYKNDTKDRKVILFLNDCSCPKKFCKEKAAIAVQGCLKRVTLEDCASDICIEYQKQTSLDGTSEATPAFVGHIHLQKTHLERINISTEDILQKCQEISGKHGMKKGNLAHLFKKITFSTCDCSFTQKPIDGKVPCLQFSFSEDIPMLSESVEKAVNVLADSVCGVLLDTIIKGDPRIQEAKITWVGSDATSWVKHAKKVSKGEPAVELVVEKNEALQNGDAWRIAMDACIPVINLIDTRRSIPYGIQQVRELLGISCSFDQVVQRLSTTMKTVAKGILKDHLVLVANSMTCTGNLNGFNNAGYKATFRSLKVQVPFTESTLFTPMKCFEKAAEKCHSDSLGCVVSSCSWGKHAALGTGSSFEILWNENQLKSNKEYGDGLYDFLALVRTDQEKARYTFLDDVDYLVEDNAMDDICLSPELDGTLGMPTFEDCLEQQVIEKGSSWDNGTTANASWEQNASAGNDSDNWGGWSNADTAADTGAAKPADQGNSSWNVPAAVDNDSTDWGGWGTEKAKDKKTVPVEPAELNTWADQSAKKDTNGNWGKQPADQGNPSWNVPATVENDSADWGAWGTEKAKDKKTVPVERAELNTWADQSAKKDTNGGGGNWGKQPADQGNSSWNVPATVENGSGDWGGWGTEKAKDKKAVPAEPAELDAWADQSAKKGTDGGGGNWGKQPNSFAESEKNLDQDSWGNMPASPSVGAWGKKNSDGGDGTWEKQASSCKKNVDQASWGNKPAPPSRNTWRDKAQTSSAQEESWGHAAAKAQTSTDQEESWGNVASKAQTSTAQEESWGNAAASPSDNAWNAAPVSQGNENSDAKDPDSWDGWGSAQALDSSTDNLNKINASNTNKGWKSDGWAAKENRRDQRDNPGRPPMRPDERPPRPRFELPAEAKKIIHEIEPIVTMVRKIFRESCDGVNLSLEDEKFIKEKILEHHPEKEKKLSAETDNIMVNKHHIFQDSRCFYVVSSDGTQTDFSYNKCMDNYVRKTYAEEHAELVSRMYFMKRNRDQAPALAADGATAPATPAEASQSTLAEASQATPAQDAQRETPASPSATQQAPPGETASQETPASPSATTQQETPEAAAPPVDQWAVKPDSAWGAGTSSDDKWA
uniref:Uncharacterized protein n=1 Tax=Avena sativa TaxID=4498 RepID=A0ACD5V8S4_AVESA